MKPQIHLCEEGQYIIVTEYLKRSLNISWGVMMNLLLVHCVVIHLCRSKYFRFNRGKWNINKAISTYWVLFVKVFQVLTIASWMNKEATVSLKDSLFFIIMHWFSKMTKNVFEGVVQLYNMLECCSMQQQQKAPLFGKQQQHKFKNLGRQWHSFSNSRDTSEHWTVHEEICSRWQSLTLFHRTISPF